MAKFAPGFKLNDLLEQQLKCPGCSTFMKPPIYQCSSGHPICEECFGKEEKCLSCNEEYKKELKPDIYPGYRMYNFHCIHKPVDKHCLFSSDAEVYHHLRYVEGNGLPFEFICLHPSETCGKKIQVYPLNGALVTEEEFQAAKKAFRPMRNYHLEMYTAFVLYPCVMEGCSELVGLAEKRAHEADCVYRAVSCPIDGCDWKGSVQSVAKHVFDSGDHADIELIKIKDGVPFELPHELANQQQQDGKPVESEAAFLFASSVLVFSLKFPKELDAPICISVGHYGLKSVSDTLACEVRFKSSKFDGESFQYSMTAQNDMEAKDGKKWINIPSYDFLDGNGYVTPDIEGLQMIKVRITIKEKPLKEIDSSPPNKVFATVD